MRAAASVHGRRRPGARLLQERSRIESMTGRSPEFRGERPEGLDPPRSTSMIMEDKVMKTRVRMSFHRRFFTIAISVVVSTCGLVACADTAGPSASACQNAGGICISQGLCEQANGTVVGSSAAGCASDNVAAECCVPPAPQPNPMTCAEAGGLCASIGGCLEDGGYFTSTNAGCDSGPGSTCCVPYVRCGEPTIECCHSSWVAYPSCDNGELVCTSGDPVPTGTCEVP
jgi:hypothetical protein